MDGHAHAASGYEQLRDDPFRRVRFAPRSLRRACIACPGRGHCGGGVSSMLCGTAVSNIMSRGQLSTMSR